MYGNGVMNKNTALIFLFVLTVACDNQSPGGSGDKVAATCGGQMEVLLRTVESYTMLPTGSASDHPWEFNGLNGYTISSSDTDKHVSKHIDNAFEDHESCGRVYAYLDPSTITHEQLDKAYNYGDYHFNVSPLRYHEANPEVFSTMAGLSTSQKLDENVNTALNQTLDAGDLDTTLFFVGINPDLTNEILLGGHIIPDRENKNIIGAFSDVALDCGDAHFNVRPVLRPSFLFERW